MWDIEFTDEFEAWWDTLSAEQQEAITGAVEILEMFGPSLGRPLVDHVKGSRHRNMKELRVSRGGALRILFAFDPRRIALLLLGGDKTGEWSAWYERAVPQADSLYDEHLRTLSREEGER